MKYLKTFLPLLILAICMGIGFLFIANKPEAKRHKHPRQPMAVVAVRLKRQDFPMTIRTQGTVRPRTESTLIPEVPGRIIKVASNFRAGGFFEQGDVLLHIDPRNAEVAVTIAEASVAEARFTQHEEIARGKQALRDWQRLSQGGEPGDLVLRKPQRARVRATLASAKAQLRKARLDLERTRITAPYAGRVMEQQVDVGQYVSPGTVLALIYAVDVAEIRLPLSHRQMAYVPLPELYRGETLEAARPGPPVVFSANVAGKKHRWRGTVVRTEGAIDVRSRQLFVVAQVADPYGKTPRGTPPLKIGQFVKAAIKGQAINNAFVLPRGAVREGNHLLMVDENEQLQRRPVELVWADEQHAVVSQGLREGERVCTTPLNFAAAGTLVRASVKGEAPVPGTHPGWPHAKPVAHKQGAKKRQGTGGTP